MALSDEGVVFFDLKPRSSFGDGFGVLLLMAERSGCRNVVFPIGIVAVGSQL